jgi:hypothetical protein
VEEKEDGEIDEEPESEAGAIFRMSADDSGSRLSAGGCLNGQPTYITEKNHVVIMLPLAVGITTITIVIRSRKRRKQ